ncbi:MAG: DUF5666 domain-containing protein [Candidatus Dormibacteria bacterium]
MKPITITATIVAAGLGLAACGSTPAAGGTAIAKASPSPGQRVRNGASGELVQITGTTLVLNATTGDITVVYDASTTFQKTSTGTFHDIATGKCIVATGAKDPSGSITAATVRLSSKVNGTCTLPQGPGGGGGFGGVRPSPSPGASPRPNRGNIAFAGGEVTAVAGTSVTVQPATGPAQTVMVATTVQVSNASVATPQDLALHQCLSAQGPKDASGKVTARSIAIVPAGPTGCFTGGRGGFGGFGRPPGGGGGAGGVGGGAGD